MNGIPDILPDLQQRLISPPDIGGIPNIILPKRTGSEAFRSSRGAVNAWYSAGLINGAAKTTFAMGSGINYAMPFVSMQGGWVDQIAFAITTGGSANSHARCGIYTNYSEIDTRPHRLLFDSGDFAGNSTGVKASTCQIYFEPGQLYWVVISADGTTRPTVAANLPSSMYGILGVAWGGGNASARLRWSTVITYGSLPAMYPSGGLLQNASTPDIQIHFADKPFPDPGGYIQMRGYEYYKYLGNSSAFAYHIGGVRGGVINSTQLSFGNSLLYFIPFCYPRGGYVEYLAIDGTGSAASNNCRLGIYTNRSRSYLYPEYNLWDSGDISTASGVIFASYVNGMIYIEPNQLYWLSYCVSSASVNRYRVEINGQYNLLGSVTSPTTGNMACGRALSFTYGALPKVVPNGAGASNNSVIPAVGIRFMRVL